MARRKSNFTTQIVTRLIEEVESRSCLWDTEHEHYNDRHKMTAAWQEISKNLDIPVDTLRIKWKSLRDFFIRMLRMGGIKDVEEYTGRWQHFRSMWFLYKSITTRTRADSGEEMTTRSGAESGEETTTNEDRGVMVKCEPIAIEQAEVFLAEYEPTPPKRRRKNSDDDFDEMFLKSLTPFFKKLEPVRKLIVRSKIQEILLNEIAAQTTNTKKFH